MSKPSLPIDPTRFINPAQAGGIEQYILDAGPSRGVRALCVNTGAGLRYRVLPDRGLDIDHAFLNHHSLTFLTHLGILQPNIAMDRGLDWLKTTFVGLLTSCGPFNTGAPAVDEGTELGLHGPHTNTPATIESILQPDPASGRMEMSITGSIRYGRFFGPCLELKRTIRSRLGENAIDFTDEFYNPGNQPIPHAWLLHINFGWPLLDENAEFCYRAKRIDPLKTPGSQAIFASDHDYKRIPAPLEEHAGRGEAVAYLYPTPLEDNGLTTIALINQAAALGVAIHYNTRQFPRCGNWQHFGRHEYVAALEPMTGGVEGRDIDRQRGWLQTLNPAQTRLYQYRIEATNNPTLLQQWQSLNQ